MTRVQLLLVAAPLAVFVMAWIMVAVGDDREALT